jgi:hypothetical protein
MAPGVAIIPCDCIKLSMPGSAHPSPRRLLPFGFRRQPPLPTLRQYPFSKLLRRQLPSVLHRFTPTHLLHRSLRTPEMGRIVAYHPLPLTLSTWGLAKAKRRGRMTVCWTSLLPLSAACFGLPITESPVKRKTTEIPLTAYTFPGRAAHKLLVLNRPVTPTNRMYWFHNSAESFPTRFVLRK